MITAIIQARSGSTRLPGKALKPILGKLMLEHMIERVKQSKKLDRIVIATTDKPEDDAIVDLAKRTGAGHFRGDEQNVLDRFYKAAKQAGATTVIRLTGDCPLIDPAVIDEVIEHFLANRETIDYMGTPANYPEGLDTEIFPFAAIEEAWKHAQLPSEKEHVTPYIKNHPETYTCYTWKKGDEDFSTMHWSVDTPQDFEFVTRVFEVLHKDGEIFHKDDVIALLRQKPELLDINKGGTGYEGLQKSLKEDGEFKKTKL